MCDAEHLLDREREIASIDGLLADASAGIGGLLTVCGAAGTGKTVLLDHAADLAAERGMTVLRTRGGYAEADLPFELVRRLFEPQVDIGVPAREPTREELHQALAGLAARGPVLLAVDDVHWADHASLCWLVSLPLRIEHQGVAMMVSACAGDPSADHELLDDLLASAVAELCPAGLGEEAAATLLGGDPDRATACWELTAGNPALLTRLAAELTDDVDPQDIAVPALARTVHVWLRRVSAHAVTLARAVAVLGDHATLDRVAHISGVELSEVADVVSALERKGLMRITGGVCDFAQPLVRATVKNELSFAALQRVHCQAARLLHESGAPAESIAEHLLAAGPVTDGWEIEVLRTAAAAAVERGSPDLAVTWLRHASTGPAPVDLLVELANAEEHVDVPAAIARLTSAAELGAEVTAELTRLRGIAGHRFGRKIDPATLAVWQGRSADEAIVSAERVLGGPLTAAEAPAFLRAIEALVHAGKLNEALHHSNLVIDMARAVQHLPVLGEAHAVRSAVVRHLGRLDSAAEDARAAVDLVRDCGVTRFDITAPLVEVLLELGDHVQCAHLLGEAPDTWQTRLLSGRMRSATGMPTSAVEDLRACGKLLEQCGADNPAMAPWRSDAAIVLHGLGRTREAAVLAGEEVELARRWGAPGPLAAALRAKGMVARGPLGLALTEEALSLVETSPYRLEHARCLVARGAALRATNQLAAARRTLHDAVNLATECGAPLLVDQAKAELTAAGGRLRDVSRTGPDSLTAAEYRVATLAACGEKTTKQIAAQLFVTRRTIEIHLANAYRKLGIRGRHELRTALPRKALSA